jgi:hypothetical protein
MAIANLHKFLILGVTIIAIIAIAMIAMSYLSGGRIRGHDVHTPPNAKIGDSGFDTQNEGEFNAVATVEALPEVIQLRSDLQKTGTVVNISVICGDGPVMGRTFWVVNVVVDYKDGHDAVAKTYHYDIHSGQLSVATTQASP